MGREAMYLITNSTSAVNSSIKSFYSYPQGP